MGATITTRSLHVPKQRIGIVHPSGVEGYLDIVGNVRPVDVSLQVHAVARLISALCSGVHGSGFKEPFTSVPAGTVIGAVAQGFVDDVPRGRGAVVSGSNVLHVLEK